MKIAVCIPHYGDVKAGFAESLARLVLHSATALAIGPKGRIRPQIELFFRSSSVLPQARTEVVAAGLGWGADWLLLIDADQTFPPDALFRLLRRGKPVIGCNYLRRNGTGPVIEVGRGVGEVDHLGLGFLLVHRDAFAAMIEQAKAAGRDTAFPLFMLGLTETGEGYVGEDVYFCRKLRDAGFSICCDHDLSLEIGHVGERVMMLAGEGANADSRPPAAGHQQRR